MDAWVETKPSTSATIPADLTKRAKIKSNESSSPEFVRQTQNQQLQHPLKIDFKREKVVDENENDDNFEGEQGEEVDEDDEEDEEELITIANQPQEPGKVADFKYKAPKFASQWETDPHRLAQRQRQIDLGKNTVGYHNYVEQVPKPLRARGHPRTPDIKSGSRRAFLGRIRVWRKELHRWDVQPGEEGKIRVDVGDVDVEVDGGGEGEGEELEDGASRALHNATPATGTASATGSWEDLGHGHGHGAKGESHSNADVVGPPRSSSAPAIPQSALFDDFEML